MIKLPSKFVRSVVRSDRLKFQGICPNDLRESFEDPTASIPTSEVKAVSIIEVSISIPEISECANGKWPLDADVGLRSISDTDDIVLHEARGGADLPVVPSIMLLYKKNRLVKPFEITCW